MSDVTDRLRRAREFSNREMHPVFDWALHEAVEAEYRANVASDAALTNVEPKYPTVVRLLSESMGDDDDV